MLVEAEESLRLNDGGGIYCFRQCVAAVVSPADGFQRTRCEEEDMRVGHAFVEERLPLWRFLESQLGRCNDLIEIAHAHSLKQREFEQFLE